ncbi:MAG TPA: cation:proton antiporter, partial [Pyrinomonadaceae bacterium]
RDAVALSARAAAVVGWCGMRGTVTLAAALALPAEFPRRDLIFTTAFGVTLGTLVLQGLTLRPLMLRLRLEDDGTVEREARLARVETLRAAVEAAASPGAETTELVRRRYELQLSRAEEAAAVGEAGVIGGPAEGPGAAAASSGDTDDRGADAAVVEAAGDAQRRRLMALREEGTIGDAAFQRIEEELDWAELGWAQVLGVGRGAGGEG